MGIGRSMAFFWWWCSGVASAEGKTLVVVVIDSQEALRGFCGVE